MSEEKAWELMRQADGDQDGAGTPGRFGYGWKARHPLDPFNVRDLADRGFGATRLFRILMTNACAYRCDYCPMRAGRDLPRHALAPEELARIFMTAHRKGLVDGLFITSGIPKNPRWAMDRMIELVERLRFRHRYAGYLHAKAVSGAEPEQIEQLALLCERVSYNLEAACQATLDRVAPEKNLDAGIDLLRRVKKLSRSVGPRRLPNDPRPPGAPAAAGATAQFMVGVGAETDRDFLSMAHALWKEGTLHHPHFAAFRPIEDTPLENAAETPSLRENRLYQADYLIRQYEFHPEELVVTERGNLPLGRDPKLTWALAHPEQFPVDAATASRETLLRVPGLGPRSVARLLALRRAATGIDLRALRRVGAVAGRAAGFLTWRGRLLGRRSIQEPLFQPEEMQGPSQVYSFSPGTFR
ncbi:MAG: radical SAM protein [Thermoanaerobaculia bacterium]